ncbi:MAG TPA: DUF3293 domain-containing protein [Myxococcales bacterium]
MGSVDEVHAMTTEREREESFEAYPATRLSFDGGPRIDLRFRPDDDERRALRELELGPSFAVLTAESPRGEEPEDLSPEEAERRARENIRRTLRFEERLAKDGVPFRRVDATAPDGGHRARCVAVALSREEASRLAREQEQVALFWWDGRRFWVWPAEVESDPRPLPAP